MPKAQKTEGIYKRAGSRYYYMGVRVNECKVVNRSTRMQTKSAALEVYNQTREQLIKESMGVFTHKTPRDILEQWETMALALFTEKYVDAVKKSLKLYWSPLMDRKIATIRADEVHRIHLAIKAYGFAAESFNKAINAFSCLITYAREELGWIRFVDFKFKRERVDRKRKRVLAKEQLPLFLHLVAIQNNLQSLMIISLMLGLALRETEALHACWSKFSYDAQGHLVFQATSKTKKERTITVPDWLEVMLRRYQQILLSEDHRPSRCIGRPRVGKGKVTSGSICEKELVPSDWMFPSVQGRPHSAGYSAVYIKRAGAEMGIKDLSPHRLRGSSANLLKLEGLSLDEIQGLLGHAHLSTTSLYIEQNLSVTRDAQNALGGQLWPEASSLVKELRQQVMANRGGLLPLPPEAGQELLKRLRGVDTPGTRLLPGIESIPNILYLHDELPLETQRQSISTSIQDVELQPRRGRPAKSLLEKLVWELPTVRIAEIYGVSDTAIGKWCAEYGVAKPERGYWAKRFRQ